MVLRKLIKLCNYYYNPVSNISITSERSVWPFGLFPCLSPVPGVHESTFSLWIVIKIEAYNIITPIYYLTVLEVRSRRWLSLDQNQDAGRVVFLVEALGETCFLIFSSFSRPLPSFAHDPFLHLQSQQHGIFKSLSDSTLGFSCHVFSDSNFPASYFSL